MNDFIAANPALVALKLPLSVYDMLLAYRPKKWRQIPVIYPAQENL